MRRHAGALGVTILFPLITAGCSGGSSETPKLAVDGTPRQTTLAMDSFVVPPGAEFYKCQDVPNPFGSDIAIIKTDSTVSFGAHHMYAFQIPAEQAAFTPGAGLYAAEQYANVPDRSAALPFMADGKKTPLFDCPAGGLEFHAYFHLTQRSDDSITYPAGVGRSFKASEAVRFNVHYVNTTDAPLTVGASVTVTYVAANAVPDLAAGMFVFASSLSVPAGASTQSFSYAVPQDMNFLQVTGHMHRRGKHFDAHVTDAAGGMRPMYTSDTWDEPATEDFQPAFTVKSGEKIDYSCLFQNDAPATLTYGESAEKNEMCNIFGVYYPAPGGNGILGIL